MKAIPLMVFLLAMQVSLNGQHIGIGTANPAAGLHTTGTVRHAALNGVGVRPVFADNNENHLVNVPPVPATSATNNTLRNIPDLGCKGVSRNKRPSGLPVSVQSSNITVSLNITHPGVADLGIYPVVPECPLR